jgi:hypothetical protein
MDDRWQVGLHTVPTSPTGVPPALDHRRASGGGGVVATLLGLGGGRGTPLMLGEL